MTDSVWPAVHAGRRALADDRARWTPEQWATRSLCSEWIVHDVLAHKPARFLTRVVRAGFHFDRFAEQVAVAGSGGPEATPAGFRAAEPRGTARPGPKVTRLGEALLHGEDIRRHLGIEHRYPLSEVARAIRFYAAATRSSAGGTGWRD